MKPKLLLTSILLLSNFILSAQRIVGYFPFYKAGAETSVQYDKLTDIVYAFISPNADGSLQSLPQQNAFDYIQNQCNLHGVKFIIGTGGAGLSGNFASLSADSTSRRAFAGNIANFVMNNNMDGVDLDWEFPSPSQTNNFELLIRVIRDSLDAKEIQMGRKLELSAAIGGELGHLAYINASSFQYFDYLNIMAYDAPASLEPNHSSLQFALNAIDLWEGKGLPRHKMVLGVPFYGRAHPNRNDVEVYNIISVPDPAAAFVDDNFGGNYFYNGKPTLEQKVDSALSNGLAGIMIWELAQDRTDQYSLLTVIFDKTSEYRCPKPDLGPDLSLCNANSLQLYSNLDESGRTFRWTHNGNTLSDTGSTITIDSIGVYSVTADSSGCVHSDEIEVVGIIPDFGFGPDVELCDPTTKLLDPALTGNLEFIWEKDGITFYNPGTTYLVKDSGAYKLTVNDPSGNCASKSDEIIVTSSLINVSHDTIQCGGTAQLDILDTDGPYDWYDQEVDGNFLHTGNSYMPTVSSAEIYYVQRSGTVQPTTTGRLNKSSGWNRTPGDIFQKFQVFSTLTIDTVTIYPTGPNNIKMRILAANKTTIVTESQYVAVSGVETKLPVNIQLTPGTYFMIPVCENNCALWFDQDLVEGDYQVPNVMTVFEAAEALTWTSSWYGHVFRWQISGNSSSCKRTPVFVDYEWCVPLDATQDLNKIKLSQNPFRNKILISTEEPLEKSNILIQNITGNILYNAENVSLPHAVNTKLFPPGIYFFNIYHNNARYILKAVKD